MLFVEIITRLSTASSSGLRSGIPAVRNKSRLWRAMRLISWEPTILDMSGCITDACSVKSFISLRNPILKCRASAIPTQSPAVVHPLPKVTNKSVGSGHSFRSICSANSKPAPTWPRDPTGFAPPPVITYELLSRIIEYIALKKRSFQLQVNMQRIRPFRLRVDERFMRLVEYEYCGVWAIKPGSIPAFSLNDAHANA